jgi:23S rRNA pseudouridine1911/1915/1917 synthase
MEVDSIIVTEEEAGSRVDKVLALHFPDYSRTYFQSLITNHLVLVNEAVAKKAMRLVAGDEIEVEFTITPEIAITPEPIPLDILFEDEYLLAINKPVGMVVHPAVGNWSGTFVNALLYHCGGFHPSQIRPGIVHRLDKQTSGVLLAAKNEFTQRKLVAAFATRHVYKEYRAICIGNPHVRRIEGNIGRHPTKRKEMAIVPSGGKEALTLCETLAFESPLILRQAPSLYRKDPSTACPHALCRFPHTGGSRLRQSYL